MLIKSRAGGKGRHDRIRTLPVHNRSFDVNCCRRDTIRRLASVSR